MQEDTPVPFDAAAVAPGVGAEAGLEATAGADQRRRWGIGHAALGWVVSYLLAGLAVGFYALFADVESGERTLGLTFAVFAGLWAGMLGTVWLAKARQPGGTLRSEFGWAFRWVDVPIGALAGVLSQFLLLPLVYLPWQLLDPGLNDRLREPAEDLTGTAEGAGFWVLAVFIAVGAPVVEELFYRGLLQRAMVRRLGAVAGIGLTALLFGLAHQAWVTLPGLTAFAVVVGVLAHKTGRLGPAVMAHVFFNAVTVIALGTQ